MVSTLAWNGRNVGMIAALSTMFPIFIAPMKLVAVSMILYKLCVVWLLNPTLCLYMYGHSLYYVIVSIKRLTIPGW